MLFITILYIIIIEYPQALLAAINDLVVVAGYKSGDNVEAILHAAAEKEGPQDFDEDEVIAAGAPGHNIPQAHILVVEVNVSVPMSAAALKKLKKDQLFHQLTIRGVIFEMAKSKAELNTMLGKSLHLPVDGVKLGRKKAIQLSGLTVSAFWRKLNPAEILVDPINLAFQSAQAPTVPENDTESVPIKHNFSETFECNTFLGKVSTPKRMKKRTTSAG